MKQKKTEQEILLETLGNLAIVSKTDRNGTITYVNDLFVVISRYSREELIGQNHRILKSGFHPPEFYEKLWKTITQGKIWRGEIKNRAKDGSFYWVESAISPLINEQEEIEGYIAVRFPITKQKEIEEKLSTNLQGIAEQNKILEETKSAMLNLLEDSNQLEGDIRAERDRMKSILASMGEGLFVVDKDFKITMVNPAAEIMLEMRDIKLIGSDIRHICTMLKGTTPIPDEEHPVTKSVREGRIGMIGVDDDISWQTSAGKKFPVATVSAPLVVDTTMNGAVMIFRDITAEKALDESKRTFISIASHQLRTPLTSIRWYAEMLESGDAGPLNKDQKGFLAQIYNGVLRLAETLNILLSLARIEGGRVKVEAIPVNIPTLTNEILKELIISIEEKQLTIDIKKGKRKIPDIPLDANIARQVIMNLTTNAIRYSNTGGIITISFEPKEKELLITVQDNGIGIPEKQKEKIFEKFFRADNAINKAPDGTGLGLALVKQLVGLWHGRIWFESEEGKHTTFSVTIPYTGMQASAVGKEVVLGK